MANNLTLRLNIAGINETLRKFREMPKEASDELRDASKEIADDLAAKTKGAATSDSPQSALIAPTIKAVRDRVPVVQAGGTKRVGRNRVPAYKVLFGSEFGSNNLRQFRPHRGAASYWFFKAVENEQSNIAEKWNQAADRIINKWGS